MFTDAALAARIDGAEAALALAITRAIGAAGHEVTLDELAGGVAALARPGAPTNKIVGVGFGAPIDLDALAAIEARWWARGEPVRFELSTIADGGFHRGLTARGYQLDGFENVLARRVVASDAAPVHGAGITVERVTAATDATWLEVGLDGFATPDQGEAADPALREMLTVMFRDFASVETPRYLARVDGEPAGMASASFTGGVLLLCGAATTPRFRRRGVQRALLAERLADGVAAGCDLAVVTTAPSSQSMANVMRAGFGLAYARAVLIRNRPEAA